MGWFRGKTSSGAERDPELPLRAEQAQRLRELVRAAWARVGREVTVHSDHVVDRDGGVFGLWNIAALVAEVPERQWARLVGEHVGRLAAPTPSVAELSDSQLRAQLVLRVVEGASLPDASWWASAPTLAGDLRQVLALDFPHTVAMLRPGDLAARGDLDEWRAVGRANLWHMMRSETREHRILGSEEGGQFHVLLGDSFYTASMVVFLAELMSLVGQADLGRGVLVAIPLRHQVAFRVVDGSDAAPALHNLFRFAMAGYDEGAGPVSPHVFWVKDGRWEQVTEREGNETRIVVGSELAEALGLTGE